MPWYFVHLAHVKNQYTIPHLVGGSKISSYSLAGNKTISMPTLNNINYAIAVGLTEFNFYESFCFFILLPAKIRKRRHFPSFAHLLQQQYIGETVINNIFFCLHWGKMTTSNFIHEKARRLCMQKLFDV